MKGEQQNITTNDLSFLKTNSYKDGNSIPQGFIYIPTLISFDSHLISITFTFLKSSLVEPI